MKIAVFGCGYVGGTVADWLESQEHTVYRIDPKLYPMTDKDEALMECSHVIIAVPTPMLEDGTCDDSAVKEILSDHSMDYRHKILLKSTVTPELINNYPVQVCVSPEFLRARHAKQDFENSEVLVVGHHENNSRDADEWIEMFIALTPQVTKCSRETASLIKYTHNAWLATKVAFFHELFKRTRNMENFSYNDLSMTLSRMKNIGASHMIVPNDEGGLGYTGHCFPKDIEALTNFFKHSILEQVKATNKQLNKDRV
jgi:UDP-glucose 6-dehydrogenase|tara:strand:+ start:315 stop:1082 length:768 start_codon:yes stop_codon:yes gene_type:complete